jgi:hypothetical protein
VRDLIASRGVGLIVVGAGLDPQTGPEQQPAYAASLRHLLSPLARSACALLFLTLRRPQPAPSDDYPLANYAALRLLLQKELWLNRYDDVAGYQARVTLLKSNGPGRAGQQARIAVIFNGTVRGDGT